MNKRTRRNLRTLLLACFATATLVWSAIVHFDVPAVDMAWLFLYSAMGVFFIILLAAASVALIQGSRALWRRLSRQEEEQ